VPPFRFLLAATLTSTLACEAVPDLRGRGPEEKQRLAGAAQRLQRLAAAPAAAAVGDAKK
jgi:hypothetical protein